VSEKDSVTEKGPAVNSKRQCYIFFTA